RLDNATLGSIHWTDLNSNLNTIELMGIALHPTDPNIALGGAQDNGTNLFTDNRVWNTIQGGDGGFVYIDPSSPNVMYHTFFYSGDGFLERSDDGGKTWFGKTLGIATTDPAQFYPPYELDPVLNNRLILGTTRVWETTTSAEAW